jgi:hypothetical protein
MPPKRDPELQNSWNFWKISKFHKIPGISWNSLKIRKIPDFCVFRWLLGPISGYHVGPPFGVNTFIVPDPRWRVFRVRSEVTVHLMVHGEGGGGFCSISFGNLCSKNEHQRSRASMVLKILKYCKRAWRAWGGNSVRDLSLLSGFPELTPSPHWVFYPPRGWLK